jgi:hypothetical protein
MYTVTVCILCVTAVVAVASVIFALAVVTLMISHGVKYASSALRAVWRNQVSTSRLDGRFLPELSPRRAR